MLNRNELIVLRKALDEKPNKNALDYELLSKLQKLINQPVIIYEIKYLDSTELENTEEYHLASHKKANEIIERLNSKHEVIGTSITDKETIYYSDFGQVHYRKIKVAL
jgi:endonuclease V-like protein UPF0215 family